jgi:hypothetical protein
MSKLSFQLSLFACRLPFQIRYEVVRYTSLRWGSMQLRKIFFISATIKPRTVQCRRPILPMAKMHTCRLEGLNTYTEDICCYRMVVFFCTVSDLKPAFFQL